MHQMQMEWSYPEQVKELYYNTSTGIHDKGHKKKKKQAYYSKKTTNTY